MLKIGEETLWCLPINEYSTCIAAEWVMSLNARAYDNAIKWANQSQIKYIFQADPGFTYFPPNPPK